jgi:hypothetical protein
VAEPTKVRLLRQAIRLAGMEKVSKQLRASREMLDLWSRGLVPMPDRKLLPLVDLLDRVRSGEIPPVGKPPEHDAEQRPKRPRDEEDR